MIEKNGFDIVSGVLRAIWIVGFRMLVSDVPARVGPPLDLTGMGWPGIADEDGTSVKVDACDHDDVCLPVRPQVPVLREPSLNIAQGRTHASPASAFAST